MAASMNLKTEIKPNHVIIWADKNMGIERNNRTSKKDLSNNVSVDFLPSDERRDDIDNFIHSYVNNMNNEKSNDLIKSPLRMFTDETECIKCIHDNLQANKQPFLIASGKMGELIVPEIYEKLSGYIYIFCAHMEDHLERWAGDYVEHMQMFNEETTVFVRLLRDIAQYYLKKSEDPISDRSSSIKYLQWAQRLVQRANKMDNESGRVLLRDI